MKRWVGYGALWAGVFLLAFLWQLPAAFVLKQLPVPKSITLVNVQGPWWQGTGELLWQQRPAGRLAWSLGGFSVLWGAPQFDVRWQLAQAHMQAVGRASLQKIEVIQADGYLPTHAIQGLIPPSQRMLAALVQTTLVVDEANAQWRWQHTWPAQLTAQGQLKALKVMEVTLPDMDWQISPGKSPQTYEFSSTGTASWGRVEVKGAIRPQGYQVALNVIAQAGKQPPVALISLLRPVGSNVWHGQWQSRW